MWSMYPPSHIEDPQDTEGHVWKQKKIKTGPQIPYIFILKPLSISNSSFLAVTALLCKPQNFSFWIPT